MKNESRKKRNFELAEKMSVYIRAEESEIGTGRAEDDFLVLPARCVVVGFP